MKSNSIYLRAFEIEDYKVINRWRNDDEIQSLTGGNKYFVSSAKEKQWVEEKIIDNAKNIYLAICLKETGKMIGYLSINDIDWRNKKALWGGLIIGDKEQLNKGCATEASLLMLDYVFSERGLHRFFGHWLKSNHPSLRVATKLGFQQEGILRDCVYKANSFHDLVVLSILKEEFEKVKENLQNESIS